MNADKRVTCEVCHYLCTLGLNELGRCKGRINRFDRIESLLYGHPQVLQYDTVDAKPFYHCPPGARLLSFGFVGCNAVCPYCINWELSTRTQPLSQEAFFSPEMLVEQALAEKCWGVCASFNEPTIALEYVLDIFSTAKRSHLRTLLLTNGLLTDSAIAVLAPWLDAVKVDFKRGIAVPGIDPNSSWRTARMFIRSEVWVEISMVFEGEEYLDEYRVAAEFVLNQCGTDVPWHILRMTPSHRMIEQPVPPLSALNHFANWLEGLGLQNVYLSNVPGHALNHTYCLKCRTLLVRRYGSIILENKLQQNRCYKCGEQVQGVV